MARILRLTDIQIRQNGATPVFRPDQMREVFQITAADEGVNKLMLSFEDSEGRNVGITLRDLGEGKWIIYGSDDATPFDDRTVVIPNFEDIVREFSAGRL